MTKLFSQVALVLIHLSVVLGFARLYDDGSFFPVLAAYVIGAHLLAVSARRLRIPAPAVALIAVAGAALATGWLLFPGSTRFGLPTGETLDLSREAVRISRAQFDQVTAPTSITPGFQLMAGLALWCSVWFADWAAFRLRATIEAVAPPTVLFTFGALLGSGQHQFSSATFFTATVLLFTSAHRAWRAELDGDWLTTSPAVGPRALLRAGVVLAGLALVTGALVGPRLPGAESDALISWRGSRGGSGNRTTVSPIVDLRKRLVNQSNTELFTVTAQRRSYWRLTSLDRFDGQLWSSGGQFSQAEGLLRSSSPNLDRARDNRQTITVSGLSAIWVPVAFEARTISQSSEALRWDPESATLIVEASGGDAENTSDGLQYSVISEAPQLDPTILRRAGSSDSSAIEDRYGGLPDDFPGVASQAAREATQGAVGRYEKALALQNWFRSNFTYSLDVPAGNGDDALVEFLGSRLGYCEQFSGAYAAMARSLGIPSRVAVGFTPGQANTGTTSDDDPTTFTVRGRHAHAWPELWFPGVGWVPFEPTPGRGIPGAESYTNVAEAQDSSGPTVSAVPSTSTSTTAVATATTVATNPTTTVPTPDPSLVTAAVDNGPRGPNGPARLLLALGLFALAYLAAVLVAPRVAERRRLAAATPAAVVLDAWHQVLAPVRWLTGLQPRAAETHVEFAERAAAPLGTCNEPLGHLAVLATTAAWDPAGASVGDAQKAQGLAQELRADVTERQSQVQRLRRRLSLREAFDRPRGERSA